MLNTLSAVVEVAMTARYFLAIEDNKGNLFSLSLQKSRGLELLEGPVPNIKVVTDDMLAGVI